MARGVLPHMPHHVVQRGHNGQVVFTGAEDYERYLEDLRELSSALDIRVYAYCLLTNHVHLLLGPAVEDYPWSGYRQRTGGEDCWINPDPAYLDLADNEARRQARYARFVQQGVPEPEPELKLMPEALQRGQLTGNPRLVDEVEQIIGCRIERRPGRPLSRRRLGSKSFPVFRFRSVISVSSGQTYLITPKNVIVPCGDSFHDVGVISVVVIDEKRDLEA